MMTSTAMTVQFPYNTLADARGGRPPHGIQFFRFHIRFRHKAQINAYHH